MATKTPNPLVLTGRLAAKLAAVVVHAEELLSPAGHEFDMQALRACCRDPEVQDWLRRCGPLAPVKRSQRH